MTQEEKAKAYDNMFERLKEMYNSNKTNVAARLVYERYFPELVESEDKKTRKEILDYIIKGSESDYDVQQYGKERFKKWIAWLEKQGEQKHTPKHKVGDIIYYNSFGELKSMIVANVTTDSTDNPMYEDESGNAVFEKDLIEPKSTEIEKGAKGNDREIPNSVWSEEDEDIIEWLIGYLEYQIMNATIIEEKNNCLNAISMLKSLRPQNWKPSEEQMEALRYVTNFDYGGHKATLVSLYEQLKKLKG